MSAFDDFLKKAMPKAVREVMEGMAFMEILEVTEEDLTSDALTATNAERRGVSLLVHDPVQWEFKFVMSADLLAEIAESVYASPREELAAESLNDLLAEILNTVAGRFLSVILRDDQVYNLGLPEPLTEEGFMDTHTWKKWHFTADAKPFTITMLGAFPENMNELLRTH